MAPITTKPPEAASPVAPPPPPDFDEERGAAVETDAPSAEDLVAVVFDMGGSANDALKEICAIAKMSLKWMESPDGHLHVETVARGLHAIWRISEATNDHLADLAMGVNCALFDEAEDRRFEASESARWKMARGQS